MDVLYTNGIALFQSERINKELASHHIVRKYVENRGEKATMKGGEDKSRCMGYWLDFPAFRAKLKVYL
jgi:hypothetical protein